jgi:hypothetical protein
MEEINKEVRNKTRKKIRKKTRKARKKESCVDTSQKATDGRSQTHTHLTG